MTKNQPELKACELLPCPFCGQIKIYINERCINCPSCLATMPNELGIKSEMIECWNARPSPIIPEDAFTARYIEGCGTPPTAQDDVVVEPVKCPDPENCKANGNCTSSEPVIDDRLREAVEACQFDFDAVISQKNDLSDQWVTVPARHLKTLIIHAIKGRSK